MATKAQAKPSINNFFLSWGLFSPSFFTKINMAKISKTMSGMANSIMLVLYG